MTQLFNSRISLALLLGFFSGLPFQFTRGMLQGWLLQEGLKVDVVTALSFVTFPYAVKFLWAPVFDLYGVGRWGRRRGWMFVSQLLLAAAVLLLSTLQGGSSLTLISVTMVLVSFFGASQDIAIDGYRVELLRDSERAMGAAAATLGYRIGMIVTGAGALIAADHLNWSQIYQIAALLVCVGACVSVVLPNVESAPVGAKVGWGGVEPFLAFFRRSGAFEVVLFVLLYKVGDVMASTITLPFLREIGFSFTEIGTATKAVGVGAAILGGFVGGWAVPRIGVRKALLWFGVLQCLSTVTYCLLLKSNTYQTLLGVMFFESFTGGLGSTALVAFLMGMCERRFSASQYALLSGVTAVSGSLGGVPAGALALILGWKLFFVALAAVGVPPLFLVNARFDRWLGATQEHVEA